MFITDIYKLYNGAQCPFILLRIIIPSDRIDLNLSPDKYTQNILGLEPLLFAMIKQSILKMNEDCFSSLSDKTSTEPQSNPVPVMCSQSISKKRPLDDKTPINSPPPSKTPCFTPIRDNRADRLDAHIKDFGVCLSPETDEESLSNSNLNARKKLRSKTSSPRSNKTDSPKAKRTSPRKSPRKKALPSFQEIVQNASISGKKDEFKRKFKRPNDSQYTEIKTKSQASTDENQQQTVNDLVEDNNQVDNDTSHSNVDTQNIDHQNMNHSNFDHQVDNNVNCLNIDILNTNHTNINQVENLVKQERDQEIEEPLNNVIRDIDTQSKINAQEQAVEMSSTKIVERVNLSMDGDLSDDELDELLRDKEINLYELDKPKDYEASASIIVDIDLENIDENFENSIKLDQASCENSRFEIKFSLSQDEQAEQELYRKLNKQDFEQMKIIGQFNTGFILAELDGDIFLIDQHAADERFNFEKVCTELKIRPLKCVRPMLLELTAHDENIIIDHLNVFEKNGFRFLIDKEGVIGKRIKLDSVPLSKSQVFCKNDLEEIIDSIVQMDINLPPDYRPSNIKKMLGYEACRKSIMIGDTLNECQMRSILNNLAKVKHPTSKLKCIDSYGVFYLIIGSLFQIS